MSERQEIVGIALPNLKLTARQSLLSTHCTAVRLQTLQSRLCIELTERPNPR